MKYCNGPIQLKCYSRFDVKLDASSASVQNITLLLYACVVYRFYYSSGKQKCVSVSPVFFYSRSFSIHIQIAINLVFVYIVFCSLLTFSWRIKKANKIHEYSSWLNISSSSSVVSSFNKQQQQLKTAYLFFLWRK